MYGMEIANGWKLIMGAKGFSLVKGVAHLDLQIAS